MAKTRRIEITPVLAGGGAYAAGDAVGVFFEIPNIVDYPGKGGKITGITLVDKAAQALGITLQLFNAAVAGVADNAAYNQIDADALKGVGQIVLVAGDYAGGANNKTAYKQICLAFETLAAASLWGCLFTQGAPTYAVGDLLLVLHVETEDDFGH